VLRRAPVEIVTAATVEQWGERRMLLFRRFLSDQAGATAIEYGLIAAGISVAIIATVMGLGTKLKTTFEAVDAAL
jgi:pilus assembly protein Flp/PilA